MNYLIVVPVEVYRVSEDEVALESAFCDHLRALLENLGPRFDRITIAAVAMPQARYDAAREHLGVVSESRDHITVTTLYDGDDTTLRFWARRFAPAMGRLVNAVRNADLVHSGTSHNLWRPIEFPALLLGVALGKKTISVTDMDLREDAHMLHTLGRWSRKSYMLCKYVYDPIRHVQQEVVAKRCSLVLMKGDSLVEDYGAGRANVKGIRDPGFEQEHVIGPQDLEAKIATLEDPDHDLELVYFGRYVFYKGVDRCIGAVARVRDGGRTDVHLHLYGEGEDEPRLRALVDRLGLGDFVTFHEPIRYGEAFFAALRPYHLMLAAPLSIDTPRSTWDAIACGLPLLAFDTAFYSTLARSTGVVDCVPWPSEPALAERIAHYADNRAALASLARRAVDVAKENTQAHWLARRIDWTNRLFEQ